MKKVWFIQKSLWNLWIPVEDFVYRLSDAHCLRLDSTVKSLWKWLYKYTVHKHTLRERLYVYEYNTEWVK